jgi:hypothetical protein
MSGSLALILVGLAATIFMTGMIWTIQVVHYPGFAEVGRSAFPAYESAHQTRIAMLIVFPWAIQTITALALVIWRPAGVSLWLPVAGLVVAIALVALTAAIFAPIHGDLSNGFAESAHDRLVNLNWIRTALWSGHAVIAAAILVQHVER